MTSLARRVVAGIHRQAFPLGLDTRVSGLFGTTSNEGSIALTGSRTHSFAQMYETQPWVYIVVSKLARSLARLPLHVFEMGTLSDRERKRDGTLADLMREPAPGIAPFQLKESIVGNLSLYGNAILVKVRTGPSAAPFELWPTNFAKWRPVAAERAPISMWIYTTPAGDEIPFLPSDVVHFRWWNPSSHMLGMSPMEPLRRTLAMEDATQRAGVATFEHGMRPSGVFKTDRVFDATKESDRLAIERLTEEAEMLHGGPDNFGRLAFLEGGLEWQPMSHNLTESAAVPFRKLNREEVAAAFDMPPPMVGILDNATFSNVTMMHQMLYQDTLGAPIKMIEEVLDGQLVKRQPSWRGQFLEFELADVLRGSHMERMRAYQLAQWFLTPNEVRRIENWPQLDDPEAARIHVPLATTTEVSAVTAEQSALLAAHVDHLEQSVRSRLGAGADIDNLMLWAARAVEIVGTENAPALAAWGPLLTELAEAKDRETADRVLRLMRSAMA